MRTIKSKPIDLAKDEAIKTLKCLHFIVHIPNKIAKDIRYNTAVNKLLVQCIKETNVLKAYS